MSCFAVREFVCTFCQQKFTLLAGDMIFPDEPALCDECLREVWKLEGEALAKHVTERLAGGKEMPVNKVLKYINQHTERFGSAEDAILEREQMRGFMK